ncbi:DUF1499 domain-containing protein [Propylenella binzhouense]|uniref:DUF1499 domain-containing protein n=1 Tax=Propylenella binzhouense TaxID=2555902 RepID=A0A964T4V5_9HYPH|nr:DUF1499 domain-containing protein [Propylenella binzhouense]MYZ47909.1 DUF1499 domain-containing protein [Propylenella binzhouense]
MGVLVDARRSRAAVLSRRLGAVALPVLALGALGHRLGVVGSDELIIVIVLGFVLATAAFAAGVYAIADIWVSGAEGVGHAIAGIVYAMPALALLGLSLYATAVYPALGDISTDWSDPPQFTATPDSLPSDDMAAYADEQNAGYPGLTARLYGVDVDRVFRAVGDLVEDRNWEIVASVPPDQDGAPGTLEAIARTPIFAFLDDVAIRVESTAEGTRVDMRSRSRIGDDDLGQNARRIRAFLADLDTALAGQIEPADPESPAPSD